MAPRMRQLDGEGSSAEREATRRDAKKMKDELEGKGKAHSDDSESVPDEDEDQGADEPALTPGGGKPRRERDDDPLDDEDDEAREESDDEPRLSRRDKKQARLDRIVKEATDKAVAEYAARTQQQQQSAPRQEQQGADPIKAAYVKNAQTQSHLLAEYNARVKAAGGKLSDTEEAEYVERATLLKFDEQRIVNAYNEREQAPQREQQMLMQQIRGRYPDLIDNPNKSIWAWSQARYNQMVAEKGRPLTTEESWSIADKAAEEARQKFRLAGRKQAPAASAATKARLSGISRGAGGGDEDGGVKPIVMTGKLKKAAKDAFPHLYKQDPKKAYQRWVDTAGRQLQKDGVL